MAPVRSVALPELKSKFGMLKWLWITLVMLIFDQVTKQMALHMLEWYKEFPVMAHLNWYLTDNPGAAFSFLSDAGGWQRWFFTVLALVVSVGLVFWMKGLKSHERYTAIGIAFILSGALGNVIDRILYGYVVDFIQYYYSSTQSCLWGFSFHRDLAGGECIWPAFNIADSAITIGAGFLILELVLDSTKRRKMKPQSSS
jgi:signal peptidase II